MAEQEPTLQEQFDAALAECKGMQRAFVLEYLHDLHGQNAAIRAGYSEKTARSQASRMLTFVNISRAVDAGLALQAMPESEVLARLGRQARGDMADFLQTDEEDVTLTWSLLSIPTDDDGEPNIGGVMLDLAMQDNVKPTDRVLHTAIVKRSSARLDLLEAGRRGKLGLVKKYSLDDKGKVSIELYDAQAALQLIGRHHKLFVDRTEVTGEDGAPLFPDFEASLKKSYADDSDPPAE